MTSCVSLAQGKRADCHVMDSGLRGRNGMQLILKYLSFYFKCHQVVCGSGLQLFSFSNINFLHVLQVTVAL